MSCMFQKTLLFMPFLIVLFHVQLSLYLTLSKLYHSMGLKRKTLFMMFNAGRQAVKMSITNVQTHYGNMNQKVYTCTCTCTCTMDWNLMCIPQVNCNFFFELRVTLRINDLHFQLMLT